MRVLCFHSEQVKAKEKNVSTYADGAIFGSCTRLDLQKKHFFHIFPDAVGWDALLH